jgi:D-serine deaminase-like pyridoxal phosphate-dependent protein
MGGLEEYERYRKLLRGVRFPLALVDLDKFDQNVAYVASTQKHTGKTIRVHSKSIRCVELLRRIFEKGGDAFRGVMTFATEETAFLAEKGFDDFILSYPTVQPSDLDLLVDLTRAGKKVSLVIDSVDHLRRLSEAGEQGGVILKACMEVDMSYRPLKTSLHLGVRRSPIRSIEDALHLARQSERYPGVSIDSIMGYEAHIAGLTDNLPKASVKNHLLRALKKASVRELTGRRGNVVDRLRQEGLEIRAVNGGGSGSLVSTGKDPSVTEVTAGSAFYGPGIFQHFKEVSFVPSAFFALQIVRRPATDIVTCHGGGYVASGPAGEDRLPVPFLPQGCAFLPFEGAGEVQTPLKLSKECPALDLGDPIFFQHAKAGELAERFNTFTLILGDRVHDEVETYRGEGKAFL